ncbi:MAG: hypothetical protein KAH12_09560 [Anaerolineales bacterium]|nr:hypothetical protein [Anaerolineales bacterium]
MRSSRLFWAVMLVGFGFVLLANNLGIITVNVWRFFWPVFLIGLGIWFLIGTAVGTGDLEMVAGSVDLDDSERASIVVKHGAGKLELTGISEPGKLVSGNFATGLDARVSKTGNTLNVVLQPQRHSFPDVFFPGNWNGGKGLLWEFGLSNELPLDLAFEIGAVNAHLDLTALQVKNISLQTGASLTNLKLPAAAGLTYLKVEAGAASIDIQVPVGVAARVEAEHGLASVNVDQNRFPKSGGVYQSPDYEEAENKVDIRIETGVSSIEIH